MIRVKLGEEIKKRGVWPYSVEGYTVEGRSRQPLLDACRQVKSLGADPQSQIGLFWPGSDRPSLTCAVGVGANLTVNETTTRFAQWQPFDRARVRGDG